MEEKRIEIMKKIRNGSKPVSETFACLNCPLGSFEYGLSGGLINKVENEFLEKKANYQKNLKTMERINDGFLEEEASRVADEIIQGKILIFTNVENADEKKKMAKEELVSELIINLPRTVREEIDTYELNEPKTFQEKINKEPFDVFTCYCSKKFQFTFDSDSKKYNHILDCDFKNGITNEVSEMITGQIEE